MNDNELIDGFLNHWIDERKKAFDKDYFIIFDWWIW